MYQMFVKDGCILLPTGHYGVKRGFSISVGLIYILVDYSLFIGSAPILLMGQ